MKSYYMLKKFDPWPLRPPNISLELTLQLVEVKINIKFFGVFYSLNREDHLVKH